MKNEHLLQRLFFTAVSYEVFKWTRNNIVLAEPHQEHQPWVGWFRGVTKRRPEWEAAWPEEEYLHP